MIIYYKVFLSFFVSERKSFDKLLQAVRERPPIISSILEDVTDGPVEKPLTGLTPSGPEKALIPSAGSEKILIPPSAGPSGLSQNKENSLRKTCSKDDQTLTRSAFNSTIIPDTSSGTAANDSTVSPLTESSGTTEMRRHRKVCTVTNVGGTERKNTNKPT